MAERPLKKQNKSKGKLSVKEGPLFTSETAPPVRLEKKKGKITSESREKEPITPKTGRKLEKLPKKISNCITSQPSSSESDAIPSDVEPLENSSSSESPSEEEDNPVVDPQFIKVVSRKKLRHEKKSSGIHPKYNPSRYLC
ncbi:unnamed protein product [Thlaspi arvense]|uniref:Uncharacterized protein n=1 Tax=Thlaspi arvense TaxID=13288 RepID=A0AAU9SCY5_THLAR|nr:unnamed protein product [Thlaspi arvense]